MNPASIYPEHHLWHYVWKLLRLQWQIFWSGLRHARLRRKIGYALFALFIVGMLVGAFVGSWFLLSFLRSPELADALRSTEQPQPIDPAAFLASVPVLLMSVAFLGILLTSFGVLLQALYLAGDMDFLLSSPVPIRAVFVAKLLQAILPNLSFIALFGLPVLFGLGVSSGYTLLYYPLVVIVLVALALAAAGISSLLVMSIVRILPARRVAEVLGFIGGILSLLCSQSSQFTSRVEISAEQTSQALAMLARLNAPWSPLAWAGRGLVDIGEGRWPSGAAFLLLTVGLSAAAFGVALRTAERWYYSGWASLQSVARKAAPRRKRVVADKTTLSERLIPAQIRGVVIKDWLVLRRDLRNMSQLVTPLILGVIYAVMLLRSGGEMPAGRGEAPAWAMQAMNKMLMYGNIGIALFVSWTLLSRLALMGFSQEGRQYWLVKTAPVSAGRLLLAKFCVAYLPTVVLGWLFLIAIALVQFAAHLNNNVGGLLFGLPVVALCTAGAGGINLAFGVMGANLDWQDPRQMVRGSAGCLGSLIAMIYMGITLALFFGPPLVLALVGASEAIGQIIGLVLGGSVSLAVAIVPPWLVRDRVALIGEA